ncbi:ankyrin repeat domain-containing protein [Lysobacter claricitrinus]|uniref:ankyrin repeat domain-containing protein n=1 Tax=Lysobacter claricitrinus TaxID=3367728 RepID=UPI0038B240CF
MAAILVAACLVPHVAARAPASTKSPDVDIAAARALLDSWHGEDEVLEEARSRIDRALAIDPDNVFALRQRVRYQFKLGYLSARPTIYNGRVYSAPQFAPGTLDQAEATILRMMELKPGFADAYQQLGQLYFNRGDMARARVFYKRAEALGSTDAWLQLDFAQLDDVEGNSAAAEARWRRVLSDDSADARTKQAATGYLLAAYKAAGDDGHAVDLYRDMIARDPSNAWLRGEFADYLSEGLGRHDEAIGQARASLGLMDYGVGHRILSMALLRKWAALRASGKTGADTDALFVEAREVYPDLEAAMAYGASVPGGETLARALISQGVSVDAKGESGSSALLIATNRQRAEVVRTLLDLHADPNVADSQGWTPLLSAADNNNRKIVQMLLDAGADTEASFMGFNAAQRAEGKGYDALAAYITAAARNRAARK